MIRAFQLICTSIMLQGCSFLVDLAFYNNTASNIEVCNLNLEESVCQQINGGTLAKVLLVGDKSAKSWRFSIESGGNVNFYDFEFGPYPTHASDAYCEGFIQKRCDIPVQYEVNSLLYWGGKNKALPVRKFPAQPRGFPVEPNV
ncbi:hypothetical protein AAOGI_05790 [Agarivorans albus]